MFDQLSEKFQNSSLKTRIVVETMLRPHEIQPEYRKETFFKCQT